MSKRLHILEMPLNRPTCAWCGKKLRPISIDEYLKTPGGASVHVVKRTFRKWAGYGTRVMLSTASSSRVPLFDKLQCALEFAQASFRGGFRRKGVN